MGKDKTSSGKKKAETYDLKLPVCGFEGEALPDADKFELAIFDKPVKTTFIQGGVQKTMELGAGGKEIKCLTLRKLILMALRTAKDERGKEVPDIDRRTEIMLKLVADTEVSLSSEERGDIIKCVRAYGDPLYLMRVKELFG
jgi:hypothetical protein